MYLSYQDHLKADPNIALKVNTFGEKATELSDNVDGPSAGISVDDYYGDEEVQQTVS